MIHPSAQIDSTAKIDEDVSIGPYTVVGPNVAVSYTHLTLPTNREE